MIHHLESWGRTLFPGFDWDDRAALEKAFQSPEGQAAAEDVPKFATGGSHSMIFDLEEA